MKECGFIYKLLLIIQTWFLGILITNILVKNKILVFSKTKNIFLLEFVLSCFVIAIILCILLMIIMFITNKIKTKKKRSRKHYRVRTKYGATYIYSNTLDDYIKHYMYAISTGKKIDGKLIWVEVEYETRQVIHPERKYILKYDRMEPCQGLFIRIKDKEN